MKSLTIGKVARLAEISVETVRFYEREGLIEKPPRQKSGYGESGYREYPEETVRRLRFIRRAKDLGFTLKEIKELLELRIAPGTTCGNIRERAESKIHDIETKLLTLQKMKKALAKLVLACDGNGPASRCPILEAMEDNNIKGEKDEV